MLLSGVVGVSAQLVCGDLVASCDPVVAGFRHAGSQCLHDLMVVACAGELELVVQSEVKVGGFGVVIPQSGAFWASIDHRDFLVTQVRGASRSGFRRLLECTFRIARRDFRAGVVFLGICATALRSLHDPLYFVLDGVLDDHARKLVRRQVPVLRAMLLEQDNVALLGVLAVVDGGQDTKGDGGCFGSHDDQTPLFSQAAPHWFWGGSFFSR